MTTDFDSAESPVVEIEVRRTGRITQPIRTPKQILDWMIRRRAYYGTPLPDGYVPPPGIDIEALLKQLPPYPPAPRSAG